MVCPTILSPFEVSIDNNYHHLVWSKVEFLGIGELCPCFVIRIADLRLMVESRNQTYNVLTLGQESAG